MVGRDDLTLALTVVEENAVVGVRLTSAGLGIYGMPANSFEVNGTSIKAIFSPIGAEFTGRLRMDDAGVKVLRIDGDWFQSAEMVPISLLPVDAPSF